MHYDEGETPGNERSEEFGDDHDDDDEGDDDEDDDVMIGFSGGFLERRRKRKRVNPTAHIGANKDELYEDPAEIAHRNWGIRSNCGDSADSMFSSIPPPVVVSLEIVINSGCSLVYVMII